MLCCFRDRGSAAPQDSSTDTAFLVLYLSFGAAYGAVSLALAQSLNFRIFCQASSALVHHAPLYNGECGDYFKYSPTFALLFRPFAWMPAWISAPLWSALNFGAAYYSLRRLLKDSAQRHLAMAIALAGISLAADGDQSNLLAASVIVSAVTLLETQRSALFGFVVALGGFLKIFPFASAIPALLFRDRWRSLTAVALAVLVCAGLPLCVVTPSELAGHYRDWFHLLQRDRGNEGWSVMHAAHSLGLGVDAFAIQLTAIGMLCIPAACAIRFGSDASWRRTYAASILVFAVLFNHRAEYASYVVSASGVAVWYAGSVRSRWKTTLVLLSIIAPGPFFTRSEPGFAGIAEALVAHREFHPLRVVPLLVAWLVMQADLLGAYVRVKVFVRVLPGKLALKPARWSDHGA